MKKSKTVEMVEATLLISKTVVALLMVKLRTRLTRIRSPKIFPLITKTSPRGSPTFNSTQMTSMAAQPVSTKMRIGQMI